MAYKEVQRVDISEVVRRWQAGGSRRRIASGTGLSRETVGKYIALAEGMGVSRERPTPTEEQLGRLAAISRPGPQHGAVPTEDRLAPWADQIYHWLTGGGLQLTRVQELLAQRGCPVHRDTGPRLLCAPQRPPPIGCRAMPAQARGLLKCQHSYGGRGEKFARGQPDKWTPSAKQPRRLSSG